MGFFERSGIQALPLQDHFGAVARQQTANPFARTDANSENSTHDTYDLTPSKPSLLQEVMALINEGKVGKALIFLTEKLENAGGSQATLKEIMNVIDIAYKEIPKGCEDIALGFARLAQGLNPSGTWENEINRLVELIYNGNAPDNTPQSSNTITPISPSLGGMAA